MSATHGIHKHKSSATSADRERGTGSIDQAVSAVQGRNLEKSMERLKALVRPARSAYALHEIVSSERYHESVLAAGKLRIVAELCTHL